MSGSSGKSLAWTRGRSSWSERASARSRPETMPSRRRITPIFSRDSPSWSFKARSRLVGSSLPRSMRISPSRLGNGGISGRKHLKIIQLGLRPSRSLLVPDYLQRGGYILVDRDQAGRSADLLVARRAGGIGHAIEHAINAGIHGREAREQGFLQQRRISRFGSHCDQGRAQAPDGFRTHTGRGNQQRYRCPRGARDDAQALPLPGLMVAQKVEPETVEGDDVDLSVA